MLYTDQQESVVDQMQAIIDGKGAEWPNGYGKEYLAWEEVNQPILNKLSAEERAKSFVRFVHHRVKQSIDKKILRRWPIGSKKTAMRKLNREGKLLLVMKVGETKTRVLTPEELPDVDPMEYQVLSSSYRSSTNNLLEVQEEQMLTEVAIRLENAHFLLQGKPRMEDGVVHVEVIHPRSAGVYEVRVDTTLVDALPVYEFLDSEGNVLHEFSEASLGDAYGVLAQDASFIPVTGEQEMLKSQKKNQLGQQIFAASLAAAATPMNRQLAATQAAIEKARLAEQGSTRGLPMDVQQAKQYVQRAQNEKQTMQSEQERLAMREEEVIQHNFESQKKEKERRKQEAREQRQAQSKKRRRRVAAGGIASGLAAAGGSGLLFILNNNIHMLT